MICYSVLSLVPDFLLDANENVYILLALQNKLIDQIFKEVDDIDLSRFTMNVDYKYNGEFSPCKLMERIIGNDK